MQRYERVVCKIRYNISISIFYDSIRNTKDTQIDILTIYGLPCGIIIVFEKIMHRDIV